MPTPPNQPPGGPPQGGLKPGTFWHTVGVIGIAVGVAAVGAYALDLHRHTCEACGSEWRHLGAFNIGDHDAHKCPGCGEMQWWKTIHKDGAFRTSGPQLK